MADIKLSRIQATSGLPRVSSLVKSISDMGYFDGGHSLASLSAESPLTTILDITEPCALTSLVFSSGSTLSATVSQLIITIDGDIVHSSGSSTIGTNQVLQLLGSFLKSTDATGSFATVHLGTTYRCESLKVEIATIGSAANVRLYGNVELIK